MKKKKLSLENLKVSSFITNPSIIRGGGIFCAKVPATQVDRCYGSGNDDDNGNGNDTGNNTGNGDPNGSNNMTCNPNTTEQTFEQCQSGILAANC